MTIKYSKYGSASGHTHWNLDELNKITDGDHERRTNNPHDVQASQITDFDSAVDARVTYEALDANGDVGVGAAQVSQGNHTHPHLGTMLLAFGKNGRIMDGQFVPAQETPSNVVGYPAIRNGTLVGLSVSNTSTSGFKIRIYGSTTGQLYELAVPNGQRKANAKTLSVDFSELEEISCLVVDGDAEKPIVLAEIIWR